MPTRHGLSGHQLLQNWKGLHFYTISYRVKLHLLKRQHLKYGKEIFRPPLLATSRGQLFDTTIKPLNVLVIGNYHRKIIKDGTLPPVQMCKFANQDDNKCWRGCSYSGSLIHILWECLHIYFFWNRIFSFISEITGILTKPSPSIAVLSLGIESFPQTLRTLVMHILFSARLVTVLCANGKAL